jgi:hypothetical protein
MALTHKLIASYTVPSDVSGYTFSSIPSTYTDLKLMWSMRNGSGAGTTNIITFNSVTSGYQYRSLFNVNDTSASASTYGGNQTTSLPLQYFKNSGTIFSTGAMYITNYASATPKSIWTDNARPSPSSTTDYANVPMSHNWSNTATISSIQIGYGGDNIGADSTFQLYGISNS